MPLYIQIPKDDRAECGADDAASRFPDATCALQHTHHARGMDILLATCQRQQCPFQGLGQDSVNHRNPMPRRCGLARATSYHGHQSESSRFYLRASYGLYKTTVLDPVSVRHLQLCLDRDSVPGGVIHHHHRYWN